jgi:uncharacterized protein (TIGR04255 family)
MKEFPKSALLFRKRLLITDVGPEGKLMNVPEDLDKEAVKRIWQFKSNKNIELNVMGDSLNIVSQYHKTYNLDGGDKFRDAIKLVLDNFFEITKIPIINRIGLRYIDECPIPSKDNSTFMSYYDSAFPLERFNLADANEMNFRTIIKKSQYYLMYAESLQQKGEGYELILDFDGFAENIESKDYLTVTDELHTIISDEYERTIKIPVLDHMRQTRGS